MNAEERLTTRYDPALTKEFRQGVKRACMAAIWKEMKKAILKRFPELGESPKSSQKIAEYLFHKGYDSSKYDRGGMTDAAMFAAMTELQWEGPDLPLPTIEERALAGYRSVVAKLKGDAIDTHVFNAIRLLNRHFASLTAQRPAELSPCDWDRLHGQYFPVLPGGGRALKELHLYWSESVATAIDSVPYRWLDERAK